MSPLPQPSCSRGKSRDVSAAGTPSRVVSCGGPWRRRAPAPGRDRSGGRARAPLSSVGASDPGPEAVCAGRGSPGPSSAPGGLGAAPGPAPAAVTGARSSAALGRPAPSGARDALRAPAERLGSLPESGRRP